MARIIQLSPQIANLIAAGEVVERPGSVVKELAENALDAGARHITVEIKSGGIAYLRVTDDGSGILPEDVRTAFLPHATSKLTAAEQLSAIGTLGFRGEALASVAAVSKVDLFTRTRHYDAGVHLCLEGGEELEYADTGCPVGTTIVVRELFYNVPARAKFLKKDATEGGYCETAVVNAAMSHPETAFHFIRDGRESFRTAGDGKLLSVLRAYCGAEVAERLRPVAGAFGETTLDGYLSPPDLSRGSRSLQSFFVNGRPVRSRLLTAAVEDAYQGRLMHGRSPICFLHLHVPLGAVDVNVHPAKLEVKFAFEKEVFSAVYHAVRSALEAGDQLAALRRAPAAVPHEDHVTAEQQRLAEPPAAPPPVYTFAETHAKTLAPVAEGGAGIPYQTRRQPGAAPEPPMPSAAFVKPVLDRNEGTVKPISFTYQTAAPQPTQAPAGAPAAPAGPEKQPATQPARPADPGVKVLGELFHTYLAAEDAGGVFLIDKHAARERQLYNELRRGDAGQAGQLLLEPLQLTLSRAEKDACLAHAALLRGAGFELEDFGGAVLLARQLPMYLQPGDAAAVLSDVAQKLLDRKSPDSEALDALFKSVACKAAVKAGMRTDPAELQRFAETVLNDPEVRSCPHGRPAVVYIEKQQLEKLFKRIV